MMCPFFLLRAVLSRTQETYCDEKERRGLNLELTSLHAL